MLSLFSYSTATAALSTPFYIVVGKWLCDKFFRFYDLGREKNGEFLFIEVDFVLWFWLVI